MRARPLLFALLPLFAGCSLFDGSESETAPLPSGLTFTVRPAYEQEQDEHGEPVRGFVLDVRTEQTYACFNYTVAHRFDQDGSARTFRVDGIGMDPDGLCLTAIGPARAKEAFAAAPGTYDIHFEHEGRTDRYRVVIADVAVAVTPEVGAFTRYEPGE